MRKVIKAVVVAFLVLIVLPLAVLLGVNAFDENLTPQAASYGEPRSSAVPGAENGYYALLGLGAPDGADAILYARAWIDEARAAARANRPEKRPADKRAKRPIVCDAAQTSCLAAAKAKPDDVKTQLEASQEDLARYETLIGCKRYEEVLDFPLRVSTSFPPYGPVTGAHRAYVLRAALAAERGNVDSAIAAMERDIAFQRVMMTGARTLLGKIVASAAYWRDLAFASDLMQSRTAEVRPHLPRLREMLKSPDFPAAGMGAIVESEFAYSKPLLRNPAAQQDDGSTPSAVEKLAVRFLYKPNATLNRAAEHLSAVAAAMDLPVNQGSDALMKIFREHSEMTPWQYIDNPAGNILRRVAATDEGKEAYARLRLHDVRAYGRLVALQAEVLAANVDAGRVAAFVAESDARFHDPYTGKPMIWNADSKQLGFQAQSRNMQQRKLFNTDKGRVFAQL
ncbi:MAG TPA: hypothetical protein VGP71_13845 [Burkholderiales bacterium]|jgi:hypothetical protein|nr:hypothetical protein [Burkholderiales bacterium]